MKASESRKKGTPVTLLPVHGSTKLATLCEKQRLGLLLRICAEPAEARRYFAVIERPEIDENEFNLNVPRYVDSFEPEEKIDIGDALAAFDTASRAFMSKRRELRRLLKTNVGSLR